MLKVNSIIKVIKKNNCSFFTGVPDSVLKELSFFLESLPKKQHIIAANEGAAVSIGIGHYLSTKKIPCVYMQNSGLANAINPLISIANKRVYSIPLILVIGWRGSPKKNDEPQHEEKGKITCQILKLLNIRYSVLRNEKDLIKFNKQIKDAKKNSEVVACLIEQGTLKKSKNNLKIKDTFKLDKQYFFKSLLSVIDKKTKIISSTGYNSRELLYARKSYNLKYGKDFYMVGGMGHTSSVSLGYSLFSKNKTICIDGDGSLLMHLGSIRTLGEFSNHNLKYILLNNNAHDSVGGQSTYMKNVNFKDLSKSLGFKNFFQITNKTNINKKIKNFLDKKSLNFLEVKISNNKIKNLPRPKNLIELKKLFMK
tara:strand:+ start:1824 stop:2924 length:1101 start_codon:yes stop_codon:yes gene_type:complete